jgi:hypothetical protein
MISLIKEIILQNTLLNSQENLSSIFSSEPPLSMDRAIKTPNADCQTGGIQVNLQLGTLKSGEDTSFYVREQDYIHVRGYA